jgi:hypothetical protein
LDSNAISDPAKTQQNISETEDGSNGNLLSFELFTSPEHECMVQKQNKNASNKQLLDTDKEIKILKFNKKVFFNIHYF